MRNGDIVVYVGTTFSKLEKSNGTPENGKVYPFLMQIKENDIFNCRPYEAKDLKGAVLDFNFMTLAQT